MSQHFGPTNLVDLDLKTIPFAISTVRFGTFRALETGDNEVDLWNWIERNAAALTRLSGLQFTQRIHESPFIQYMQYQLNDLRLVYEMSNHQSARYDFTGYSCIPGSTSKDLHMYLTDIANASGGADAAVGVPPFGCRTAMG
jgi:hypothetical protein